MPEALPLETPQRPSELRLLVADDVRAEVPVGSLAVALQAEFFRQVENNRHRQAVILPGQFHQGLRASGWTLVASITVSRPRASRLPAMNWSTSKAWFVTVWSFSSSQTMPRQASDERISVGLKCLRAKVLLPDPLGPIRTTRLSLGILICIWVISSQSSNHSRSNTAICVGAPSTSSTGPTGRNLTA